MTEKVKIKIDQLLSEQVNSLSLVLLERLVA